MRAPFVISYSAKLKSAPSVIRNTFSASRRIAGCYDGVKGDFSMYINDLRKSVGARLNVYSIKVLVIISGMLCLSLLSSNAYAACKGTNCVCSPSTLEFASPAAKPNKDGLYPISLEADNMQAEDEDLVVLEGDAEVSQGRQTIVADRLEYYRANERVVATGNVEMISPAGDYLSSSAIDVHAPTQIGVLSDTQFKLASGLSSADGVDTVVIAARGSADTVNLEGQGLVTLENARYTTCAEGNDDVIISARDLELDRISGIGTARGATVRFMGVPIFYSPYLSFPLDDQRKTGLLIPGIGSDEESGTIVEVPWYWNIAPNQDATITPRLYSNRGLQMAGEYRYADERSSALVYGEYLPSDDIFGDDRDMLTVRYGRLLTDNLSLRVNYNDVSDTEYFDDLRDDVGLFSSSYVPRDARLDYSHEYFRIGVRANEYQVIDELLLNRATPYERKPSVTFSTNLPRGPLDSRMGVYASYTDFSAENRLEGTRTAFTPYVEVPFENIWGFVKPRVSLHHRSYSLDNVAAGIEDSPSFTVPIFSVDAGVYLEKNSSWLGEDVLHTLEPRVYYVYAPEEDQSDVPIFDTAPLNFNNFNNIYRESRFYGEDRVGDTNQVTFGLTSRLIDNQSGDERLRFSVGQIYILDDLEQNINANQVIESGAGDLLAEIRTESKGAWTTYAFVQYDHDESEIRNARLSFGYEPKDDDRKRVQVGYYYSLFGNRAVDQLTLSATWPLSDRWQIFADERYSIEDSESLYTRVGVEYNSCCWKLRVVGQERLQNRNIEEKRSAVFVELELTTLGSFRAGL